jgi:3',5'-cyclic AMP phosphodiesterase CpdA
MQRLTIFQVGDVHFPEHNAPDADVKDASFPVSIVKATTTSELQAATRALLGELGHEPDALLVISGDLTSRGDLTEYQNCVNFLVQAFVLSDIAKWDPNRVHVVPGNHDVDRTLTQTFPEEDLHSKFGPLTDAWKAHGLDVLATIGPRTTEIVKDNAQMHVHSLNSCLGCGELRALPESLSVHLVDKLTAGGLPEDEVTRLVKGALDTFGETIDAPAFAEDDIASVYHKIGQAEEPHLAVVAAHHNLLQQALPRIDLYTDLVNAGMVRSRLCSLDTPILYLHGHIHSDPVESIVQSAPDHGQLICVSAPEFKHGFNRIDVYFADSGVPLGCVVRKFRVREHGGTSEDSNPIRIRFDRYESSMSPLAQRIALCLIAQPTCGTVHHLIETFGATGELPDPTDVAAALKEVEWLGLVEVLNADRDPKHWRLRVVTSND